jgi:hypothetical protein
MPPTRVRQTEPRMRPIWSGARQIRSEPARTAPISTKFDTTAARCKSNRGGPVRRTSSSVVSSGLSRTTDFLVRVSSQPAHAPPARRFRLQETLPNCQRTHRFNLYCTTARFLNHTSGEPRASATRLGEPRASATGGGEPRASATGGWAGTSGAQFRQRRKPKPTTFRRARLHSPASRIRDERHLYAAQLWANDDHYPNGLAAGTPAARFAVRAPIEQIARDKFRAAVVQYAEQLNRELCTAGLALTDTLRALHHRRAVRRVLVEHGRLDITRRSIPQPLPPANRAGIT